MTTLMSFAATELCSTSTTPAKVFSVILTEKFKFVEFHNQYSIEYPFELYLATMPSKRSFSRVAKKLQMKLLSTARVRVERERRDVITVSTNMNTNR